MHTQLPRMLRPRTALTYTLLPRTAMHACTCCHIRYCYAHMHGPASHATAMHHCYARTHHVATHGTDVPTTLFGTLWDNLKSEDRRCGQPPTEQQLQFADSLGYTPTALFGKDKHDISCMICDRKDGYADFRQCHNGAKWPSGSGKQRQLMLDMCLRPTDSMTAAEATTLIAEAKNAKTTSLATANNSPSSAAQQSLILTLGHVGIMPASKFDAHKLIDHVKSLKNLKEQKPITTAQYKLLCTTHNLIEAGIASALTTKQAITIIRRYTDTIVPNNDYDAKRALFIAWWETHSNEFSTPLAQLPTLVADPTNA